MCEAKGSRVQGDWSLYWSRQATDHDDGVERCVCTGISSISQVLQRITWVGVFVG